MENYLRRFTPQYNNWIIYYKQHEIFKDTINENKDIKIENEQNQEDYDTIHPDEIEPYYQERCSIM